MKSNKRLLSLTLAGAIVFVTFILRAGSRIVAVKRRLLKGYEAHATHLLETELSKIEDRLVFFETAGLWNII